MTRYELRQSGRFWFIWDARHACLEVGLNGRTRRFSDKARAERALQDLAA